MIIRCIDAGGNDYIKVGREYEVVRTHGTGGYYTIVNDKNDRCNYRSQLFEVVEDVVKPLRVRCVDNGDVEKELTTGNIYEVITEYSMTFEVLNDTGHTTYYDKIRFEVVEDVEPVAEPDPSANGDAVNHPSHYTAGKIEPIDYIKDKLTPEEWTGYCLGNVLKYASRWRHKNGVEDLKKAQVYLNWAIEAEEGK